MRCISGCLVMVALAGWPALASAQVEVVYDAFNLAEGRIPVSASLGVPLPTGSLGAFVNGEECTLRSDGAALSVDMNSGCAILWGQEELQALEMELSVAGEPSGEDQEGPEPTYLLLTPRAIDNEVEPAALVSNGGRVDASGMFGGAAGELVVFAGGRWQLLRSGSGGVVTLPSEVASVMGEEGLTAFSYRSGSSTGYFVVDIAAGEGDEPVVKVGGGGGGSQGPAPKPGDPTRSYCVDARKENPGKFVVCIDASQRNPVFVLPGGSNVLKPNTSIVVAVRYRTKHAISVGVTGTKGLFIPSTSVGDQGATRGVGDAEPDFDVRTQLFAPRQPGELDVTLEIREGEEVVDQALVELLVDQTFSSAVRVGVSAVFLGAVDQGFEARAQPGAGQEEIVAVTAGDYDLELVAGFAPFLEKNGRSYTSGSSANFAPYFGIGVLSVSPDGAELDFLKSLHLGVEWAPSQTFSVAVTGVLRRVDRLAPGSQIGGPVNGEVPTISTQSFGMGVVLNFSPELLNFAGTGLGSGL